MIDSLFGTMLLALIVILPVQGAAEVNLSVGISLPVPIVFVAPPEVVVIPGTYVYAAPDYEQDLYFYNGWWWRPWEGRWYRSRHYDSGWTHYRSVPAFFGRVPSGWRNDYRDHRWGGRPWNYERIPHRRLQRNWGGWARDRHWESGQRWGVEGMRPPGRTQPEPRAVQAKPPAGRPPAPESVQRRSSPAPHEVKLQRSPNPREVQPQQRSPEPRPANPQVQRRESPRKDRSGEQAGKPDERGGGRRDDDRKERR
jgi:hypothetical protein